MLAIIVGQPVERTAFGLGQALDPLPHRRRRKARARLDVERNGAAEHRAHIVQGVAPKGDEGFEIICVDVPLAMEVAGREPVGLEDGAEVGDPHRCEHQGGELVVDHPHALAAADVVEPPPEMRWNAVLADVRG